MTLRKGDGRFHDAMIFSCPWDAKTYTPELAKAIEEFKEAGASFTDFDDDIPFLGSNAAQSGSQADLRE